MDRRSLLAGATLATLLGGAAQAESSIAAPAFGMVGRIRAKPGQRSALAELMTAGTAGMPGCLSYVVAADRGDSDMLWVFETWASKADHAASLKLPRVREVIAKARPLIAGFEAGAELDILSGLSA